MSEGFGHAASGEGETSAEALIQEALCCPQSVNRSGRAAGEAGGRGNRGWSSLQAHY